MISSVISGFSRCKADSIRSCSGDILSGTVELTGAIFGVVGESFEFCWSHGNRGDSVTGCVGTSPLEISLMKGSSDSSR